MFVAILAIAASVIVIGGLIMWAYENLDFLSSLTTWAQSIIDVISSVFPSWLLPFVAIALALAVLSIIVKLL